jgi:hypothetical protein
LNTPRHHDVVNLSALVQKAAWDPADLSKAFPPVKPERLQILRGDREFQLPDTLGPCVILNFFQKRRGQAGAALIRAEKNHDERGAMRHLAGTLSHQAHDTDRVIPLERSSSARLSHSSKVLA